jgi:uncharacterized membrane protein HdeD (DUF308 family)
MSQTESFTFATYSLDSNELTKSAVTAVRVALGIGGTISLIIGLMMSFWPDKSAAALTWLFGLYWLIAAVAYLGIAIFAAGKKAGARILNIVLGLLLLIASLFVLFNPAESARVLGTLIGILIGVLWIIQGVFALVQSGDARSRGWAITFGIISIVAGIALCFSPLMGIQILFVIAGIVLILLGIVQIVHAFQFGRGIVYQETVA